MAADWWRSGPVMRRTRRPTGRAAALSCVERGGRLVAQRPCHASNAAADWSRSSLCQFERRGRLAFGASCSTAGFGGGAEAANIRFATPTAAR